MPKQSKMIRCGHDWLDGKYPQDPMVCILEVEHDGDHCYSTWNRIVDPANRIMIDVVQGDRQTLDALDTLMLLTETMMSQPDRKII